MSNPEWVFDEDCDDDESEDSGEDYSEDFDEDELYEYVCQHQALSGLTVDEALSEGVIDLDDLPQAESQEVEEFISVDDDREYVEF